MRGRKVAEQPHVKLKHSLIVGIYGHLRQHHLSKLRNRFGSFVVPTMIEAGLS
jgi:hypothetical protein